MDPSLLFLSWMNVLDGVHIFIEKYIYIYIYIYSINNVCLFFFSFFNKISRVVN